MPLLLPLLLPFRLFCVMLTTYAFYLSAGLAMAAQTVGHAGNRVSSVKSSPFALPFTLERGKDNILSVRQGSAHRLLDAASTAEPLVPGADGWELLIDPVTRGEKIVVRRYGKQVASLSLDTIRDTWLGNDAYWSYGDGSDPHPQANEMRYMHQSAGGVRAILTQAFPTATGWLGVLSWQFMGPSSEPIGPQHLVFLPTPAPGKSLILTKVRLLSPTGDGTSRPRPRLLPVAAPPGKGHRGGKLLLYEKLPPSAARVAISGSNPAWENALTEVGPRGERLHPFLQLPAGLEPYVQVSGRWLVCLRPQGGPSNEKGGNRIDVVDLWSKTVRPLLVEAPVQEGHRWMQLSGVDDATATLLISTQSGSSTPGSDDLDAFLLSIPSGKMCLLPRSWVHATIAGIWRGHVFVYGNGADEGSNSGTYVGCFVYDAHTLKRTQRLRIPPERHP